MNAQNRSAHTTIIHDILNPRVTYSVFIHTKLYNLIPKHASVQVRGAWIIEKSIAGSTRFHVLRTSGPYHHRLDDRLPARSCHGTCCAYTMFYRSEGEKAGDSAKQAYVKSSACC